VKKITVNLICIIAALVVCGGIGLIAYKHYNLRIIQIQPKQQENVSQQVQTATASIATQTPESAPSPEDEKSAQYFANLQSVTNDMLAVTNAMEDLSNYNLNADTFLNDMGSYLATMQSDYKTFSNITPLPEYPELNSAFQNAYNDISNGASLVTNAVQNNDDIRPGLIKIINGHNELQNAQQLIPTKYLSNS
jgi:hypothetical protein